MIEKPWESEDILIRLSFWAFKFCGKGERENMASDTMSEAKTRIEKLEDELHHCFHRINELQAALRRLIDYGMVSHQDLERAQKALEGKE